MGDLFHIAVVLANIFTGQPVYKLDMTAKTGSSSFNDMASCEVREKDEAFQLALEDFRKMMTERLHIPLRAFTRCEPGPPSDRPEADA